MVEQTDRRTFLAASGAVLTGTIAGCLGDDDGEYPSETHTITIPYGPGGGFDSYARLTAEHLTDHLGTDVTAENIEGGGGVVATEDTWRADLDGYTSQLLHTNTMIREQLIRDVEFDVPEFTYLAQTAVDSQSIAVSPDSDIETWDDFVSGLQAGDITLGAQGGPLNITTMNYLIPGVIGGEYTQEDVLDNVVYYEGTGENMDGVLSGDVDTATANYWSLLGWVESDDIDILMVHRMLDEAPLPELTPNAQTLQTANVPNGEEIEALQADTRIYIAPPGLEDEYPDRTETLREAYYDTLQDDDFLEEADESDLPIEFLEADEAQETAVQAAQQWEDNVDLLEDLADN